MKKKDFRRTFFKFAVPVATIILILSTLEFCSWFYIKYFSVPTNYFDSRMKRPEPYRNAEFFSEEFIRESFFEPGGWNKSEKTGDILPFDFNGKFFHTSHGFRRTAFQPEKYENTIYFFGGSTAYCAEVPDEYTIPSQMQLLFNKFYPGKYIVKNYGVSTYIISQQLRLLKTIPEFKHGDIVIFYDGANEIYQNIYYANIDSSIVRINQKRMNAVSWIVKFMFYLSEESYFAKLFLNPINYAVPEHIQDHVFIETMVKKTDRDFYDGITESYNYATNRNALFFHFLQPHLYSGKKMTDYEKELAKNKYLIPPGVGESFRVGYIEIRKTNAELPKEFNSFDLAEIFDTRPRNEEYYLDNVHVNHLANKRLAQKMFDIINEETHSFSATPLP